MLEPGQPYLHGWHIDALCEHIEAVTDGEILRFLANVPPGTMKSMIVSVFWCAWVWGPKNMPHKRFLATSHNERNATRDTLKCRRLVESDWYQGLWGDRVKLTGDQNAKCLVRGTPVLMADGSLKAIEYIKAGDRVLSYDLGQDRLVEDRVVHAWSNGVKPVRRVTVSDGTSITATLNHRFYGWDEWSYVGDMRPGQPLAVAERVPAQYGVVDIDDAFLVALWLAEGSKTNTSFAFSNTDHLILERVNRIAAGRGWSVKKYADCTYTVTSERNRQDGSPIKLLKGFLGETGSYGSRSRLSRLGTDEIRIPSKIMSSTDRAVLEFISAYIACDGCVLHGRNHGLAITTISEGMARDFQLLFKRFGVQANVRSSASWATLGAVRTKGKDAWRVEIMSRREVERLGGLSLYSKDRKFRELLQWCGEKKRHTGSRCPTVPPHAACSSWSTKAVAVERAQAAGDTKTEARLTGGLSWRKIKSVEDLGEVETWHMETEKTSLFFAQGLLSHNTKFENTATGIREGTPFTSMTGVRADYVILDDPMSVDDALSEKTRDSINLTFRESLPTRLNNPDSSAIVVIMQRLHEEDTSGVILAGEFGYEHLCLPMRFDPDRKCETSIGFEDPRTEEGELLFPERFPGWVVDRDEAIMGPIATAGQMQQSPIPRGGSILKREYWQLWEDEKYPAFEFVLASADTAYSKKEENDPSALVILGVYREGKYGRPRVMLMWAWAKHCELHGQVLERKPGETKKAYDVRSMPAWGLVEWIAYSCRRFKVDKLLIENKASGQDVANEMRRLYSEDGWSVHMADPNRDKVSRAHAVEPAFAAGLIYAPDEDWAEKCIAEAEVFPKGKHDDRVDAITQGIKFLRENGLISHNFEVDAEDRDARTFRSEPKPLYDA